MKLNAAKDLAQQESSEDTQS